VVVEKNAQKADRFFNNRFIPLFIKTFRLNFELDARLKSGGNKLSLQKSQNSDKSSLFGSVHRFTRLWRAGKP